MIENAAVRDKSNKLTHKRFKKVRVLGDILVKNGDV